MISTKMIEGTFVLVFSVFILGGHGLTCLDPNGNEVDWYTTYKVPKIDKSNINLIRQGRGHFYLDVHNPKWTLSKVPITDNGQAISNTLLQIYSAKSESILHIMYNDESPRYNSSYKFPKGHTKGIVAFDDDSGFWLIHSVPKFPPQKSDGFEYPHNGLQFGQSFLCISFSYKELGQLGKQLQYNQPNIFDLYIPQRMYNDFPVLHDLRKTVAGPPWFSIALLTSQGGQQFTSFAKSQRFYKDLYADLIAPTLKSDIYAETWMDGPGPKYPSNCSIPYKVINVKEITLPQGVYFGETKDHSKWATTFINQPTQFYLQPYSSKTVHMKQTNHWTCIGDINRKQTQRYKGGGSVCINHEQVWKSYNSTVLSYWLCQ